jgi:hypothetical protein
MAVIADALFAVSPYLIAKERMLATEAGSIYASWANGGDRLLSVGSGRPVGVDQRQLMAELGPASGYKI